MSQLKLETLIKDEVAEFSGGLNEVCCQIMTKSHLLSPESDFVNHWYDYRPNRPLKLLCFVPQ